MSSFLFYAYKSLIALPILFEVQNFSAENFFDLLKNIIFFSRFFGFSAESSLYCYFFFRIRSIFFFDCFISNLFFSDQIFFLYQDLPNNKSVFEANTFFFYNLSRLMVLDYMDGLFFDSIIDFQNYSLMGLVDLVIF